MVGALKRYTIRINIARLKMHRQEHLRAILDSSRRNYEERWMDEDGGKRGDPSAHSCLSSIRIQWLHCEFRVHCASGTMGIVALFRGPEIHTFSQARFSMMRVPLSARRWAGERDEKSEGARRRDVNVRYAISQREIYVAQVFFTLWTLMCSGGEM